MRLARVLRGTRPRRRGCRRCRRPAAGSPAAPDRDAHPARRPGTGPRRRGCRRCPRRRGSRSASGRACRRPCALGHGVLGVGDAVVVAVERAAVLLRIGASRAGLASGHASSASGMPSLSASGQPRAVPRPGRGTRPRRRERRRCRRRDSRARCRLAADTGPRRRGCRRCRCPSAAAARACASARRRRARARARRACRARRPRRRRRRRRRGSDARDRVLRRRAAARGWCRSVPPACGPTMTVPSVSSGPTCTRRARSAQATPAPARNSLAVVDAVRSRCDCCARMSTPSSKVVAHVID